MMRPRRRKKVMEGKNEGESKDEPERESERRIDVKKATQGRMEE